MVVSALAAAALVVAVVQQTTRAGPLVAPAITVLAEAVAAVVDEPHAAPSVVGQEATGRTASSSSRINPASRP